MRESKASGGELEHSLRSDSTQTQPARREGSRESSPLLKSNSGLDTHDLRNDFPDDPEFQDAVRQAEMAIRSKILPERIQESTGGSYFVKNCDGETVGVFKPRDEEPYGHMNPKWLKWMQRTCCPCCFGRGCLVPSQGYLCEEAASIVDERLGLHIVPKTRVVRLASETFNYSQMDRGKSRTRKERNQKLLHVDKEIKRIGLPLKVGSFQLYVNGAKDANFWLQRFDNEALPEPTARHFQFLFEKLVVLDYIIRNTDREFDNWLIKCIPASDEKNEKCELSATQTPPIEIAAIDNGLAFPFKHPDEWRAYPYHWAWLPQAKIPFSAEITNQVLPLLSDQNFVQDLCDDLYKLFKTDKGFDHHTFEKQMSVMRGQILNLTQALQDRMSPDQLLQMPVLTVQRNKHRASHMYTDYDKFTHTAAHPTPFFSWW